MTQVLFKDLVRATGRAFDDTLDFFSSEPMIGWMKRLNLRELGNLNMMIKRIRVAKSRLRF